MLGIDIVYLPEVGGGATFPAVSIVDWGTSYQMVERVPSKEPSEVWNVVNNLWLRVFGPPEVIITDPGREFLADFLKQAMGQGIVVHQIAARAPWQQGRTERHGAHFKRILEKARLEVLVTTPEELKSLMIEVEQAKNRFSNRSGFSPVQRQIGQWPRAPTAILSDEALDPTLVSGAMTDDLERLHEMRRIAQKAFVECNAQAAVRKTLHGRTRISPTFEAGDYVYVYRVPKARKLRGGQVEKFEIGSARPMWVGPGTIVLVEENNLWISMMGELWKAAKEQCRLATNGEKRGVEAVLHECKELVEVYKRSSNRAGYKDITVEEWPAVEDEKPEERQEVERRCHFNPDVQEQEYTPTTDEEVDEEGLVTNSECIARAMQRRCDGSHFHVPLLHGLGHKAQRYPEKFCRQLVKGALQQLAKDKIRVKNSGEVFVMEDEDELNLGDIGPQEVMPEGFLPDQGEAEEVSAITEEEKAAVMKLHRSVGHPPKAELVRFMRE